MPDSIDIRDLTDEQVETLEKLVELLKEQAKEEKENEGAGKEEFVFASHPSNVVGKISRKQIYEDL